MTLAAPTITCPNCQAERPPNINFCIVCGIRLAPQPAQTIQYGNFCGKCGQKREEDDLRCIACKAQLVPPWQIKIDPVSLQECERGLAICTLSASQTREFPTELHWCEAELLFFQHTCYFLSLMHRAEVWELLLPSPSPQDNPFLFYGTSGEYRTARVDVEEQLARRTVARTLIAHAIERDYLKAEDGSYAECVLRCYSRSLHFSDEFLDGMRYPFLPVDTFLNVQRVWGNYGVRQVPVEDLFSIACNPHYESSLRNRLHCLRTGINPHPSYGSSLFYQAITSQLANGPKKKKP